MNTTDKDIVLKDEERTKCEVWTRVMGYHRPTSSFNIGKQGEFAERKYFTEEKCGCSK
ncbi:anaerobic ribonucleoside-triphosphate reductase [Turicimonas muris]|uniref:anaerobic ribonucleoside-triphosphate reductase n=1 Tax=Turicimonas muris TaxID=1796652 RepID=UPI000ABE04BA|nr:anaerobic ribonucleoside-triphosphate reductase [Turicimonas muris]MBS4769213.1 hypothetical protein [Burkholderiales bacterium]MBS4846896.1 hypothetical protein [Burkholderiales bacterium]QQQ96694.1 hypothetical protein I5Q81_12325 [Turicimonas muris]